MNGEDPKKKLVTSLINHYEPDAVVDDAYYDGLSKKYPDTDTLVSKLISHYEPDAEVTTEYLGGLYSKYGVEKKSPIDSSTQGLQGLGGSSGGNLPSPLSASATEPETPFIGAGRLESIKESTEPKPAPKKGLVVPNEPIAGLGGRTQSKEGEWEETKLLPQEEQQFRDFMTNDPNVVAWAEEFKRNYGEYPSIEGGGYDYRGAFKSGQKPVPVETENGTEYHWGSIGEMGMELKSPDHPTRWKSDYMQLTGKNPDEEGISEARGVAAVRAANLVNNVIEKALNPPADPGTYFIDGKQVPKGKARQYIDDRSFSQAWLDGNHTVDIQGDDDFKYYAEKQKQSLTDPDWYDSIIAGIFDVKKNAIGLASWANDITSELTGIPNFMEVMATASTQRNQVGTLKENLAKAFEEIEFIEDNLFKVNGEITDLISDENWGEAGRMMVNTALRSSPNSIVMAGAGAVAGTGLLASAALTSPLFMGGAYADQEKEVEDINKLGLKSNIENLSKFNRMVTRPVLYGGAEAAGQAIEVGILKSSGKIMVGALGSLVKKTAATVGTGAAKKVAQEGAAQIWKNLAISAGINPLLEATSEVGTYAMQELTDIALGVSNKTPERIVNEAVNTFILGWGAGQTMSSPATAATVVSAANQARKKLLDYTIAFDPKGVDDLNAAAQQYAQRTGQNEETIKENIAKREKAVNAVPRDLIRDTRTVDLVEEKQQLTEELKALDDAFKAPVQEKIDKINAEIARRSERNEYLKKREAQGIEPEVMGDVPIVVASAITRVETDKPTTLNQLEEASSWLYKEYKRIQEMRNDGDSPISEERIADYLDKIGQDIEMLEAAKAKMIEGGDEGVSESNKQTQAEPVNEVKELATPEPESNKKTPVNIPAKEENSQGVSEPEPQADVVEEVQEAEAPVGKTEGVAEAVIPKEKALSLSERINAAKRSVEKKSPIGDILSRAQAYNRMGKRMRQGGIGNQLFGEMASIAKENGWTVTLQKTGSVRVLDENGKEVRATPVFKTQEEKKESGQAKRDAERRKFEVTNAEPQTVEHWVAMALARGTRFSKKAITSILGSRADIPAWMWSNKGVSLEFLAENMRNDGFGMDTEAEVNQDDVIEAIRKYATKSGRQEAFDFAQEQLDKMQGKAPIGMEGATEAEWVEREQWMEANRYDPSKEDANEMLRIDELSEDDAAVILAEMEKQGEYESSEQFTKDLQKYANQNGKASTTKADVKQAETRDDVSESETERTDLAKRLRDKKIGGISFVDPLFGAIGISKALYDGAIELAARQVEKGTKLGTAIANAIKYIDERMSGKKWDKKAFESSVRDPLLFVENPEIFNDLKDEAMVYVKQSKSTPTVKGLADYFEKNGVTGLELAQVISVFDAVKDSAPKREAPKPTSKEDVAKAHKDEREKAVAKLEQAKKEATEKAAKAKESAKESKEKAVQSAIEKAKQKYVNIGYRIGEAFGKLGGEIRGKAEGRKEGRKEAGSIQKDFAKQVEDIILEAINEAKVKSPGFTVSPNQLAAAAKKLLSVNFNSPLSIEKAVEYVDKVLNNATYANDIARTKKLKSVNAKRLGRNDFGIDDGSMSQALKVDHEQLSPEELADYMEFLTTISSGPYNKASNIDNVNKYAEMYREQKAEAQEPISEAQEEANEKRELSRNEAKQEAIDEFEFERRSMSAPVSEAYQKDYTFLKSLTEAELDALSEKKLRELSNAIRNMRDDIGFMSGNASNTIRELKADRIAAEGKQITEGRGFKQLLRDLILPMKVSFSGIQKMTPTDKMKRLISMMPLNRIDAAMKGVTGQSIHDTFVQPISTAFSVFSEKMTQLDKGYDRLYSKVGKSLIPWKREQQRQDEMVKLSLIAIQKEYEANPNNEEVSPLSDYMDAIREAAVVNDDYAKFAEKYIAIYESMLDSNGNFDYVKQEELLDKDTKAFYDYTQAVNAENTPFVEVSAIRNGENVSLRQSYTPISVALIDYSNLSEVQNMASRFSSDENVKPTAQSGNIKKRTKGGKPLYLDFHRNAKKATRSVLLDYYMREPLRVASKAFNKIAKDPEMSPESRAFFKGVEANIAQVVKNTFVNEYFEGGWKTIAAEILKKRGYQMALASIPRAGVEFASNLTHAVINKPKELIAGAKILSEYKGNDEDLRTLAIFAESAQISRMFERSMSIMSEQGSNTKGSSSAYGRAIDQAADAIMSTPDRAIARPVWLGSFARTFEQVSGSPLDIQKMISDPEYRQANAAAIASARNVADINLSQGFASMNPFEGVVSSQVTKADGWADTFDKYMTRFMRYEFQSAADALNGLVGRNELTRKQAAALLAATMLRMASYQFAMSYAMDGFYSLIEAATGTGPDDEEEDNEDLSQKIGSAFLGTVISMLVFRRLGNWAKAPIAWGIETLNSKFGEEAGLRNGEYDSFKNSLVFSPIAGDVQGTDLNSDKLIPKFMGPYGPMAKTAFRAKELLGRTGVQDGMGGYLIQPSLKSQEAIDRANNELAVRIVPELFMQSIGAPVPRDIRNLIIRDVFKDFQDGKGTSNPTLDKADKEIQDKKKSFVKTTLEKIDRNNSNKFISKDKIGVADKILEKEGVEASDIAEKHNVKVFKKKYKGEKELLKVFVTDGGNGESFSDPKDLAKNYVENVSEDKINPRHLTIIKEALKHKYNVNVKKDTRDDYINSFKSAFNDYQSILKNQPK